MKALREIRKYQGSTDFLLRRAPFIRLIREIAHDWNVSKQRPRVPSVDYFYWTKGALEALQEVTEQFIVGLLEDSQLLSFHAHRITLQRRDIQLALRLRKGSALD